MTELHIILINSLLKIPPSGRNDNCCRVILGQNEREHRGAFGAASPPQMLPYAPAHSALRNNNDGVIPTRGRNLRNTIFELISNVISLFRMVVDLDPR
jgi:hypothetical protein